jgi:uncharacterized membrane protein
VVSNFTSCEYNINNLILLGSLKPASMNLLVFSFPLKVYMVVLLMQFIGFCFLRPSLSHRPRRSTMASAIVLFFFSPVLLILSSFRKNPPWLWGWVEVNYLCCNWGFGRQAVLSWGSRLFQKTSSINGKVEVKH